ncbi:MAG: MarR family transcriptional regulator [Holophagae bacterium]|nr:MarR family transcriptional regulator [Holophagae bacterium]
MDFDANKHIAEIEPREYFARFKKLLPGMDLDFMFNFARGMQLLHHTLILAESYFQKVGLSKSRFLILVHLLVSESPDGESISDLCPFYPMSSPTMTGLLDTLEKEGMIARLPNPSDRRKVNIRITDAGRAFMMDFLPKHQANARAMSKFLTPGDREMLPAILQKLNTGIEGFLSRDEEQANSDPQLPEVHL